jgi:hypothetical protein
MAPHAKKGDAVNFKQSRLATEDGRRLTRFYESVTGAKAEVLSSGRFHHSPCVVWRSRPPAPHEPMGMASAHQIARWSWIMVGAQTPVWRPDDVARSAARTMRTFAARTRLREHSDALGPNGPKTGSFPEPANAPDRHSTAQSRSGPRLLEVPQAELAPSMSTTLVARSSRSLAPDPFGRAALQTIAGHAIARTPHLTHTPRRSIDHSAWACRRVRPVDRTLPVPAGLVPTPPAFPTIMIARADARHDLYDTLPGPLCGKRNLDRTYFCDASSLALSEAMRANVAPVEAAAISAAVLDDKSVISTVGPLVALAPPRPPVAPARQRRANSTRSRDSTNIRRIL